ncbi:hypothetical protein B0A50_01072 [Salinomyces thailandicus]|uniref:Mannose-6-phosphate isomerase n=1 Tax=Salinomyces thailandicus TaxID=706561 RepID=A0A4U0UE59_9PEZI|nr:hypothetical protein B0A50_01072 [Salinomyces thailandica]
MALEPIYQLRCSCNQYPWGKQGSNSLSARLCAKQPGWDGKGPKDQEFKIKEDTSYAEMWMGTYPVLPVYLAANGDDLQNLIDAHPKELLGENTIQKFGHSKIPFLPKVLSIAKALPLQLHPNKGLAAKLHEKKPDQFTDPNHKPEIAIALSDFEGFCGFKPLKHIDNLLKLEALKKFLPKGSGADLDDQQLTTVVRKMLEADDQTVKETYKALTSLSPSDCDGDDYIPKLAPRLAEQYTEADPGILVALVLMNYMKLKPGQGLYIPADCMHAYLSGDIIECMARSDNVLNTGLCPKAERDNVELFCSCLTFTQHTPEDCLLPKKDYHKSKNGKTALYAPPLSEFDVLETNLSVGEKEILSKVNGPGILLATKGSARMRANDKEVQLTEGACYFVAQGTELEFEAGNDGLQMHMSFVG